MKRITYCCFYKVLSFLSNHFDNRYLTKYKVLLGTTLLVLTNVCQAQGNMDDRLCYAAMPINKQTNIILEPNKEDTTIYLVVEEMPEFPGGVDSLMKYIERNVRYPSGEVCVSGRVTVSFVIEKDGSIGRAEILRGIDAWFDKEALRVVRSMPEWKPGKQRGREVRVKYTMPVRFR